MDGSPKPSVSSSPAELRTDGWNSRPETVHPDEARPKSKWWTPRAISLHVALAISFPGFLAFGWWQLHRALGGNELSWAYTFEWPFFACYAVYIWWRIIHDEETPTLAVARRAPSFIGHLSRRRRRRDDASQDDGNDIALAEYNAYLASLRAYDETKKDLRRTPRQNAGIGASKGAEADHRGEAEQKRVQGKGRERARLEVARQEDDRKKGRRSGGG